MKRTDVRLAGVGGQGLLLAGLILGDAAAVHDGLNAVQTINYAPLARGAPSRAEVAISSEPIYFPEVEDADILLAMSQDAYDSFNNQVKPGAVIIVNTDEVKNIDREDVKKFPISSLAKMSTGRTITGSVVALGIIRRLTEIVSSKALISSVKSRAPRGTVELNLRALDAGLTAIQQ